MPDEITSAPADLLKSICNTLFEYSVRTKTERTKADPHAYRKVQEMVVADMGKAEQLVRAALGPADPLSRQVGTILDRVRSRFIPIIEGVNRTRLQGRELHDEHPEYRPSFALAVAELHDELISVSKQVRRAMTGNQRQEPAAPDPTRPVAKHLTGNAKKAADYIRKYPGKPGEVIAEDIGMSFGGFRSRVVPKLAAHGFYNADGYHPPAM
jgi:hypothetical protein